MWKLQILILFALAIGGCTFGESTRNDPDPSNVRTAENRSNVNTAKENTVDPSGEPDTETTGASIQTKAECQALETGDNVVLKPQTFVMDFGPFENSCFVTTYNPEFDDPPMESEIAIYKDGERIFTFPGQFNGSTFGCWVEAVAFEDLNADGKNDVIVAGKCSARTAPYNENMVYINTGKTFTTSEPANSALIDLATTKAISAYVKANPDKFFK